jgi:hypothetical protein
METIEYEGKTYEVMRPEPGEREFTCTECACDVPGAGCVPDEVFECGTEDPDHPHYGCIITEIDPLYAALLEAKEADDG